MSNSILRAVVFKIEVHDHDLRQELARKLMFERGRWSIHKPDDEWSSGYKRGFYSGKINGLIQAFEATQRLLDARAESERQAAERKRAEQRQRRKAREVREYLGVMS